MHTASLLAGLAAEPTLALGVAVRMTTAVAFGGLAFFPRIDPRVQAAAALALTAAALPLAVTRGLADAAVVPLVAGEAVVGLGLGLVVSICFAAATWAGGILGSVAGLTWADDFTPDAPAGEGGAARLATWLAVAGFLAAGGHLAVIAGLVDSVGRFPVGRFATIDPARAFDVVVAAPAAALALAVSLAGPALAAVLAFHVAVAICLRSVRFAAGSGLVQAAASLVLLAAVLHGASTWTAGFAAAVRQPLERGLIEQRP